jgi:hypothetical protein
VLLSNSSRDWNERLTPARVGRAHEPRDGVDQRRLPGAVRADQPDDPAGLHGERGPGDRGDPTEPDHQPVDVQARRPDGSRVRLRERRDGPRAGAPVQHRRREPAELVDLRTCHAVRVEQGEQHDDQTTDRREPGRGGVRRELVDQPRSETAGHQRAAERGAADEADPADERVADGEDGLQRVELAVEDRRVPEGDHDAADPGDHRGEAEREQLDPQHIDPEGGGGALVRPDRDHPAAAAAPPDVRHDQRAEDEQHEDEQGPAAWVEDRVQVDPEQGLGADRRAVEPAGEGTVGEDQCRDRRAESERHDGQVDPAGAQGRQSEQDAHRRDRDEPQHHRREERHPEVRHQPARDQRRHPAERELRERQLPGVAGDDDQRGEHHAHGE